MKTSLFFVSSFASLCAMAVTPLLLVAQFDDNPSGYAPSMLQPTAPTVVETKQSSAKLKEEQIAKAIEERNEDAKFKQLSKKGIIASMGSGTGSQSIDSLGNVGASNANDLPISGAVRRIGADMWGVTISNSSKKSVSASLRVHQFNKSRTKVKSDSISVALSSGSKAERSVSSGIGVEAVEVEIVDWKAK